jgi:DNA-binding GntR family transcriptional regulator
MAGFKACIPAWKTIEWLDIPTDAGRLDRSWVEGRLASAGLLEQIEPDLLGLSSVKARRQYEEEMNSPVRATFGPLQHESAPLRNKIIDSLRRAIETGLLEPGTRLIEKDLCQQLNVSRTSLREALRQLQAEGLLTDMYNRGLAVVEISRADAENIYRIRSVLEALIVEQFIENASDSEIKELRKNSEVVKSAYRSGDAERIMTAKRNFYDRICTGAGNPIALELLNKLTLLTSSLRRRSVVREERQSQSIAEIEKIVTAIGNRDKQAARTAAEEHVFNAAQSAFHGADLMRKQKA